MRKTMRLLAVMLAFALVATACGDDDTGGDATTTTTVAATTTTAGTGGDTTTTTEQMMDGVTCDEPIVVGVITDLSGALAIYGAHINRGLPIGFAYATGGEPQTGTDQTYMVDDCEIQVKFRDDQSDAELSTTAARELIEIEGADILIGSVSSGVTAGLQGLARDNNVILIAAPAAANDITGKDFNENTFRTSRENYQDSMAICATLTKQYDTFVQIAPDYSFGYGGATAYRDGCTALGGSFPGEDVFAPADTTDFTQYMQTIKDVDAEAFLVTWAGGGFVPLLQAAIDLGVLDDKVLAASFVDNVVMPIFFGNAIGSTSGILYHYTAADNPVNDYLIAEAAKAGTFPDLFDADGMNAAIMVVEGLRATGGAADADSLRAAFEGMTFEGPKGTIEIRAEDHVAIQDMYIVKLLNLDDPEFKYFENVETVRPIPPCLLEGEFASRCGDIPSSVSGS